MRGFGIALTVTLLAAAPPQGGPRRAATLLACVQHATGKGQTLAPPERGLWQSPDRGISWRPVNKKIMRTSSVSVDPSGRWIYQACSDGIFVSPDGGAHWKLTTGFQMAEVQKICIDSENPRKAWAAAGFGLYRTEDVLAAGYGWTRLESSFRFCSDVAQDRTNAERVVVGAEEGVYLSLNGGRRFQLVSDAAAVRRLIQDRANPLRWLAVTDGSGILESTTSASAWKVLATPAEALYCIEQDPVRAGVFYCGSLGGLYRSVDSGRSWTSTGNLPEGALGVYDIHLESGDPSRLTIATRDGLYVSQDDGATWSRFGLSGSFVSDVWMGALQTGGDAVPFPEGPVLNLPPHSRDDPRAGFETPPGFEQRKAELREHMKEKAPEFVKEWNNPYAFYPLMVQVREGTATDESWTRLRGLLSKPTTDMFYSLPALAFYLTSSSKLPGELRAELQRVLTQTLFTRGDTENHWLMHYTVRLLTAQTWPETTRDQWADGRSSAEIYAEARDWILHWVRLTVTRGQGEFDSPTYIFMYCVPLLLLLDHAQEADLRELAGMMLDLILADFLTESLEGMYCGAHSRTQQEDILQGSKFFTTALHYLFAGGIPKPEGFHGYLAVAACSTYRPPVELAGMANQRGQPFEHREIKRVRNVIRGGSLLNPPVYKTTYMTPRYALGSMQGGILQPIQQHTWDVTWKGSAPNSTFFAVHPHYSAHELAMFFPDDPHFMVEAVEASKPGYTSGDKWISSSPYERVAQERNVLLALYQVPLGDPYRHLNVHVPASLTTEEKGGWIFGRDGDFALAFYCTERGVWTEGDPIRRYRCPAERTALVVIAGPEPFADYASFRDHVLTLPRPEVKGEDEQFQVVFDLGAGRKHQLRWDGSTIPSPGNLFEGPFLRSDPRDPVFTLTDGATRRVLDFRRFMSTPAERGGAFGRGATSGGTFLAWVVNLVFLSVLGLFIYRTWRRRSPHPSPGEGEDPGMKI